MALLFSPSFSGASCSTTTLVILQWQQWPPLRWQATMTTPKSFRTGSRLELTEEAGYFCWIVKPMGLEPIAYVHVMYMYYGRENKTERILDIPKPQFIFFRWFLFSFFNKQMSITQALEEIYATNMFPSRSSLIKLQIEGASSFLSDQVGSDFLTSITHISWPCVLCYSCWLCFIALMTPRMFLFSVWIVHGIHSNECKYDFVDMPLRQCFILSIDVFFYCLLGWGGWWSFTTHYLLYP